MDINEFLQDEIARCKSQAEDYIQGLIWLRTTIRDKNIVINNYEVTHYGNIDNWHVTLYISWKGMKYKQVTIHITPKHTYIQIIDKKGKYLKPVCLTPEIVNSFAVHIDIEQYVNDYYIEGIIDEKFTKEQIKYLLKKMVK